MCLESANSSHSDKDRQALQPHDLRSRCELPQLHRGPVVAVAVFIGKMMINNWILIDFWAPYS